MVPPGEGLAAAVVHRAHEELGCAVAPTMIIPDFRYRSVDVGGVVGNESCPVFADVIDPGDPEVAPSDAMNRHWASRTGLTSVACRAL